MKPWVASHGETREHLSDYVEGNLDPRTQTRVMRHLARCERCRMMLESFKRTLAQLRALGDIEQGTPAPATVSAILRRIAQEEP
jgi:anti-sigma factor RsiW